MAKTVPVYVSINTDNSTLNEQPKSVAADGLTEMWVRPGMLNYLLENWQKYLVVDGQFKRTSDDFADLSVDHLLHVMDVLNGLYSTTNEKVGEVEDITEPIPQIQQMLIQASQAQAQASSEQTQMKMMLVQMSQAMAQSQAATTE
ncbi:hypothetical protein D8911_11400 [Levilactobacillus brevis]|nr:hypothetical protein D8911_11400 [Levilactobacillus brevis]